MKHLVYNFSNKEQKIGGEIGIPRIADRLVDQVIEAVAVSLSIPYNQRVIFDALLKNNIKDWINNRDSGILQQYSAWVLDIATESLIKELGLPKSIKVNHEYAEHAKLIDIIKEIKKMTTSQQ